MIYELRTTISVTRLSANAFPTFSSSSHLFSKLFLSIGNLHLLLLHIRYFPSFLAPTISKAHKAWENMRRYRLLYWTGGERWEEFGGKLSRAHLPSPVCKRVLENTFFFGRRKLYKYAFFGVSVAWYCSFGSNFCTKILATVHNSEQKSVTLQTLETRQECCCS